MTRLDSAVISRRAELVERCPQLRFECDGGNCQPRHSTAHVRPREKPAEEIVKALKDPETATLLGRSRQCGPWAVRRRPSPVSSGRISRSGRKVADQARVEVKQDSCCRRACSVAHANDCDGISMRSTKCRERGNFDSVYTSAE